MADISVNASPSPSMKFDSIVGKDKPTKALVGGSFTIAVAILLIGALGLSGHILMHLVTGTVLTSVSGFFTFTALIVGIALFARVGGCQKLASMIKSSEPEKK